MSASPSYRPGVCNIGPAERGRRYWLAAVGSLVTVAYFASVVGFGLFEGLLVGLFVPATLSAEAAFQAASSFCVGLAYRGEHAVDGGGRVENPAARRADRFQGARLTGAAIVTGALVTALGFGLALLV